MEWWSEDPARIDPRIETRSTSFENPTGERGAGGTAHGGRKGSPNRVLEPGERVVLADLTGPGRIRHVWMTFPPMPPEEMRAVWMEVRYDERAEPSVSVPCLDFFGLPHGRPVPLSTALTSAQEGHGFNSWIPMPFRGRVRLELTNSSRRRFPFYYQVDWTREPVAPDAGLLHASFRRENPTRLRRDFVIAEGLGGPGRFLGCCVGVRVLRDEFQWYGEGEVKMYLDGDDAHPTWCGTGLEDYVGSAWGLGPHAVPLQGAPLVLRDPADRGPLPDLVGFYRWHLPDPVVFRDDLRVTLQQIGAVAIPRGQRALRERLDREGRVAGAGWARLEGGALEAYGIAERSDDYCAVAYVYCQEPQPVPPLDVASALRDIERRPYERISEVESMLAALEGVLPRDAGP